MTLEIRAALVGQPGLRQRLSFARDVVSMGLEDIARSVLMGLGIGVTRTNTDLHRYVLLELRKSPQTGVVRAVLAGVEACFPRIGAGDSSTNRSNPG